jgi:hypothetical protein
VKCWLLTSIHCSGAAQARLQRIAATINKIANLSSMMQASLTG